jgi:uncharacterized membrane protein YhaH (DUF805 family)
MTPTIAALARLFFSFRGRAARMPFWLVSITWAVLVQAFDYWWAERGLAAAEHHDRTMVNAALFVGSLPILVSCFAISVRRLHDRDKSAWWLLVFAVGPFALEAAGSLNTLDSGPAVVLMVASLVLSIWSFIELGCMPGTAGTNRYGLDPLLELPAERPQP